MLGHSSIQVTLDRYGHTLPSLAEGLADSLDEVMREAAAGWMRDESDPGAVPCVGSSADHLTRAVT